MGRLFWKFFAFFFLAQLTTVVGVSVLMSLRSEAELASPVAQDGRRDAGMPPEPPSARFPSRPAAPPFDAAELRPRPVDDQAALRNPPPMQPPLELRADTPPGILLPPGRPGPQPTLPILAGLFAALAFSALLAAYVSRPIRALHGALAAAGRGELDVRAANTIGGRRDELADLGHAFDRMADQLQAVLSSQQRLLHDVSHELRSPLARQQLALDLARQQPDKSEACMLRLERELTRMDTLVGELLTLSRLDSGAGSMTEEEVDVGELLAGIVEDAGFEAEQRGRRLKLLGGELNATVRGRPELLHRAIENVVRNAIQHTAPDTEVVVQAEIVATTDAPQNRRVLAPRLPELHLTIIDNGPGVADEDLPRLFEPFYRGSDSRKRDGHGLGLAIAQRVIHAHGGQISAQTQKGGGLRVHIVLPVLGSPQTQGSAAGTRSKR